MPLGRTLLLLSAPKGGWQGLLGAAATTDPPADATLLAPPCPSSPPRRPLLGVATTQQPPPSFMPHVNTTLPALPLTSNCRRRVLLSAVAIWLPLLPFLIFMRRMLDERMGGGRCAHGPGPGPGPLCSLPFVLLAWHGPLCSWHGKALAWTAPEKALVLALVWHGARPVAADAAALHPARHACRSGACGPLSPCNVACPQQGSE